MSFLVLFQRRYKALQRCGNDKMHRQQESLLTFVTMMGIFSWKRAELCWVSLQCFWSFRCSGCCKVGWYNWWNPFRWYKKGFQQLYSRYIPPVDIYQQQKTSPALFAKKEQSTFTTIFSGRLFSVLSIFGVLLFPTDVII